MADLLTHYVSARVAGLGVRDRTTGAIFVLGVFFPDLMKLAALLPEMPHLAEVPSHTPFGLLFACGALSMVFARSIRARAFGALYLGSLLHLLFDLAKDYLGSGSVFLFYPFLDEIYELGLYRSEDVFYLLPINLGVLAILWALSRKESRRGPRELTVDR